MVVVHRNPFRLSFSVRRDVWFWKEETLFVFSLPAYVFREAVAPSAPPSPAWSLGVTDLWICVSIVTLPLDLCLVSHAVIDTEGSIVGGFNI